METSILKSTKQKLSINPDYTAFDDQIVDYINTAFSVLQQLGVGPEDGFIIEGDSESWEDFLIADNGLNTVQSYVYLRVRMLFDPPSTSFHLTAMQTQLSEYEWRISTHREWMLNPVDPAEEA